MRTFNELLSTQGLVLEEDDFHFEYAQAKWRAVIQWCETRETHEEQDMDISLEGVERAVLTLLTRKAGDHDDIVAEIIKCGGSQLRKTLWKFLNAVWESKTIPQSWKSGTIISLHNSGDSSNPGNYRGITLMTILRKSLSIIILKRLEHHVRLHESQAAFRKDSSCEDEVYMLRLYPRLLLGGPQGVRPSTSGARTHPSLAKAQRYLQAGRSLLKRRKRAQKFPSHAISWCTLIFVFTVLAALAVPFALVSSQKVWIWY
jgi:hypothetical protein